MIIQCPSCKARYNVPDEKLRKKRKLKCSSCQTVFEVGGEVGESSAGEKDTAKMGRDEINNSLWTDENLKLPNDIKISIAVIKGARAGYVYNLDKPYVLIGRGKVDLIIPDKEISRKHVAVEVRNDKIFLRDLGSTNGTLIGSEKVSITEIKDQMEFRIGQTTLMLITTPKNYDK
ncbi:MAG: FHA domain-containing protein [Candidatus Omnitrophota bacterium]